MKLWKATAAMVMAFGFAFSAAACGEEGGMSSSSSSSKKPIGNSSSVSVSVSDLESVSSATSEKVSSETSESTSSEETSSESTSSEESTSSTGGNTSTGSGNSSTGGNTSTGGGNSSSGGSDVVNPLAENFMNLIEKSISETKSMKLTYEFNMKDIRDISKPDRYYDTQAAGKMNVEVSFEEDGADIHAEIFEVQETSTSKTEIKQADVYLVDGYVYVSYRVYDYETSTYVMSPYCKTRKDLAAAIEEVQKMVNKQVPVMPELMEIAEELLTKLENAEVDLPTWEDVRGEALKSFGIQGNKMVLGFEAPAYINTVVEAVLDYNYEQTVEQFIDAALVEYVTAAAGETQLTLDLILDEVAECGSVEISAIYDELDTQLKATYNMTIQEMYSAVVTDETFEKALILALNESGMEDAETFVENLQSTDLKKVLFGEGGMLEDATIDDVLAMMQESSGSQGGSTSSTYTTSSSDDEVVVTMEMVADMLREQCAETTLADLPPVQGMIEAAETVKERLTMHALGMEIGAEFTGSGTSLALKDLYYKVDIDVDAQQNDIYHYESSSSTYTYTSKSAFFMQYTLSDFSKETKAITLPADIETVEVWFCENGCGEIITEYDYHSYGDQIVCEDCCDMLYAWDMGTFANSTSYLSDNETIDANSVYWGKFVVTSEGEYRGKVITGNFVSISLLKENGNLVSDGTYSSGSEYTTGVEYLQPGTYYIRVKNGNDDAVNAVIYVEKVYRCSVENCDVVADETLYGVKYCKRHHAAQYAEQYRVMINGGEYETYGGKYAAYQFQVVSNNTTGDYTVCFYSDSTNGWLDCKVAVFKDVNLTEPVNYQTYEDYEDGLWVKRVYIDCSEVATYYVLFQPDETVTYTVEYSRGFRQIECVNCGCLDLDVKQVTMDTFLCADCEANWLADKCYYAEELGLNEQVNLPDYGTDKVIKDLQFTQDNEWYRVYKVVVPDDEYSGHYHVCAEYAVVSIVLYDENGNKVNMTDNGYNYSTEISSIQGNLSAGTYYVKVGKDMNNISDYTIQYLYFARDNGR